MGQDHLWSVLLLAVLASACRSPAAARDDEPASRKAASAPCASVLELVAEGHQAWLSWPVVARPTGRLAVGVSRDSGRRTTVQELTLGSLRVRYTQHAHKGMLTYADVELTPLACPGAWLRLPRLEAADGSDLVLRRGPDGISSISVLSTARGSELPVAAVRQR